MENFAEFESWPVPRSLRQTIDATKASWARSTTITTPAHVEARPAQPGKHRVAFLIYRGNPRCGGQGVYTRHLTRELVRLGHSVEVFAGPPWPELDDGVGFSAVRGLDLYRDPDPFRIPALREFTSLADVVEFAVMLSGGFGEPLAYSMRIKKIRASWRYTARGGRCSRRCITPSRLTVRSRSITPRRLGSATARDDGSVSCVCKCVS